MYNVFKSQLYQLRRDIVIWGIVIGALAATFILHLDAFEAKLTGSETLAGMNDPATMSLMAAMLVLMVIVANVMGKDFLDKTLNYEVLSGHTRKEVFFGRLIVATTIGVFCSFLVIIAVPATLTAINGWGNTMALQGVLIRYSLVFVTLFRIAWELAFLTTLSKNPYITYLLALILGESQFIISTAQMHFTDFKVSPLLPIANCLNLLTFQDWSTFFLDETDQIVYSSAVTSEMMFWALIPSIVIGAVVILLTYVFFRHDDLN